MAELRNRFMMRWEQAVVYVVGALLVIGAAMPSFEPRSLAIVFGIVLIVLSLGDGPRGLMVLCRDVKRHVVGP